MLIFTRHTIHTYHNVLPNRNIYLFLSKRKFSKFDIFKKLSDSSTPSTSNEPKRKPSNKVISLVDEILNLTLIEAADLCDLCQEKLAERSGKEPMGLAPGRSPFPHPQSMFAYGNVGPMSFMPMPQMPTPSPNAIPIQEQPKEQESTTIPKEETKPVDVKVSIKLISFDPAKKIAVVKQVRTITGLGLRESKELVEGAPKILKKGINKEEAEGIKKLLEEAGGTSEIY